VGIYEGAVQTLKDAISETASFWDSVKLTPKEDVYVLLSKFQREFGDLKGALSSLESALERNADDPWLINDLATEYADQGVRLERAVSLIDRALKYQPENPLFLDTKGWVLFKLGRREDAKATLERCLELFPDYQDAREHFQAVSGA